MKISSALRTLSFAAVASSAILAHATDAYSDLGSAPNVYTGGPGYGVSSTSSQGFRFAATATGTLSGFTIAMNGNPYAGNGLSTFTLTLYQDSVVGGIGTSLGAYSGAGSGISSGATRSALVSVLASGTAVTLTSGSSYWLVASSTGPLMWDPANSGSLTRYSNVSGTVQYGTAVPGAFSVQVTPTPEPTTLAALGLGGLALLRRRHR